MLAGPVAKGAGLGRVVFVHGVAQQNRDPESLREGWRASLNRGLGAVVEAGSPVALATDDVRMAFWGRLFVPAGAQGPAEADPAQWDSATRAVAEELALEWLAHAADAEEVDLRVSGREALDELEAPAPAGEGQGLLAPVRRALELVGRLRLTERVAFPAAARVMRASLYQVAAYLSDDDVRERTLKIVADQLDDTTRVLVGHSLGAVIAFEACHRLDRPLPLLLTLGSPLGLQSVVYRKLRPSPPQFPPQVSHWVNVADRDDIVAARLALAELFPSEAGGGRLVDHEVDNAGFWTHGISGYLQQALVAYPLARALAA